MSRHVWCALALVLTGCGGAASGTGAASETTPAASTEVASAPVETPPAPAEVSTGTWTVGGQPFAAAVAVAVRRDDGHYTVMIASAPIDCAFARDGGVAPENLREVRVETTLEPGAALESRSDDASQQVVFVYDGPSAFEPGRMTLQNTIAQGTFTVLRREGTAARLRLEAQDGMDAARNAVSGEVDVTVCE
jgi:hypothetical protein